MGKSYVIASGKGGVGKSTLAAALACSLAKRMVSVALVDADTGLRCADLLLGMENKVVFDLGDVLKGECKLVRALIRHPEFPRLSLLAAPQLMRAGEIHPMQMKMVIKKLHALFDVILIDAPAGLGRNLSNVLGAGEEYILVATPDDVSLRDAEKMSSLLMQKDAPHPFLVLNRLNRRLIRRGSMLPPDIIAASLDMPLLGVIPESAAVYEALLEHRTAAQCDDKRVVREMDNIAMRLLGADIPLARYHKSPVVSFFTQGGNDK